MRLHHIYWVMSCHQYLDTGQVSRDELPPTITDVGQGRLHHRERSDCVSPVNLYGFIDFKGAPYSVNVSKLIAFVTCGHQNCTECFFVTVKRTARLWWSNYLTEFSATKPAEIITNFLLLLYRTRYFDKFATKYCIKFYRYISKNFTWR